MQKLQGEKKIIFSSKWKELAFIEESIFKSMQHIWHILEPSCVSIRVDYQNLKTDAVAGFRKLKPMKSSQNWNWWSDLIQYNPEFASQIPGPVQGLRVCQRTWPKDHCNQPLREEKHESGSKGKERKRGRGKGRGKMRDCSETYGRKPISLKGNP